MAQTQVSSSMAGVLNALTPLFALVVGLFLYKVKFIWPNILGIILGLIGAASLIIIGSGFNFEAKNLYPLLIILATLCYAFNVNITKEEVADLDGVTIIAIAFIFIGPFAGIYLLNCDFSKALNSPYIVQSFSSIFLLALLGSVIATILFNYLIKYTTALFASTVTYIIPVVAIFWGLLDGETIMVAQSFSIVVILLGVYLVNKKKA
jgi:drug/metabolite transporter (DMT)-like permease